MKAIVRTNYGPPEVLEIKDIPTPNPKADEVLVRVYTTTVNRTDCAILTGRPWVMRLFVGVFKPRQVVAGTDFAGQVEAVGKNVSSFKMGDRVWGFYDEGLSSHSQFMVIKENKTIAKIPDNVTYSDAVASGEGAHYAINLMKKISLKPDANVIINGSTGAIGTAALQLLKNENSRVTAVCDTKNISLIESLGADKIIDYTKQDFTDDSEQYDFILDTIGNSSFKKIKHLLKDKGVYISSELGPNAENLYLPLITKIKGGKRVKFPIPTDCKKSILMMTELLKLGKFKPVIDRTYPMEEIAKAYTYVMKGHKTGNVIIDFK